MPDSARPPLRCVAIVGDGTTALAAAIALRRALPQTTVMLVPAPADPAAFADHTASLTPHLNAFHRQIGLDSAGLTARAGAAPRLGTGLVGWTGPRSTALHPFGAGPADGIAEAAVPWAVAAAGRFAEPSDDPASPLADLDYGLRVDPAAYRRHMAALAAHLGVERSAAGFAAALPDDAGGIAEIRLEGGAAIAADLFIDCSGPAALLASALPPSARADWSRVLPCDRVLVPPAPQPPQLTPLDRLTATPMGWRSEVHGREGTHLMFAASAAAGTPEDWTRAAGFAPAAIIPITPGRRDLTWQANVVTLGEASAQFEPLLGLGPTLVIGQIGLLLELLPGRDLHPLERAEFNRRAGAMADRVRDFIALHYTGAKRPQGPFWAHAARLDQPESLRLTLGEFSRRGRLPFFEEDIMPRDAWLYALASIGEARGPTARLLTMPPPARKALIAAQRARAEAAVAAAQPYPQWLARHLERAR